MADVNPTGAGIVKAVNGPRHFALKNPLDNGRRMVYTPARIVEEEIMEDLLKIDKILDCQGLLCPMPLIKTTQAIKQIQVGQILAILATDPGMRADMEAWTRRSRHELVSSKQQGGIYRFLVRRTQ
jgi:tRNA 2-thiouridine synthesizing protein A